MANCISYFHVNTFTSTLYRGSPIGVCIVQSDVPDCVLQNIAAENALPETAFISGLDSSHMQVRWFTPSQEVDICGIGTLAAAFVFH